MTALAIKSHAAATRGRRPTYRVLSYSRQLTRSILADGWRRYFSGLVCVLASLSFAPTADCSSGSFISTKRELVDPDTGRRIVQLTEGDCFDMPMYYYDRSFTADGRTIVFYRFQPTTGEIQLYSINIDTGVTQQLTHAKTSNSLWRPYLEPPGFGVRELMSAVNPITNEAIYFDSNEIRAVNISTLSDRLVARVPPGKVPSGLTSVSPDGRFFCYPYFDEKWYKAQLPPAKAPPDRWQPRDSRIVVVDLATGECTDVLRVNFWITHTNFVGSNRILFSHNATDYAMGVVELDRPFEYHILRTDTDTGHTGHRSTSDDGRIVFEIMPYAPEEPIGVGIYDLVQRKRTEYRLNLVSPNRTHIGHDFENEICFFEIGRSDGQLIVYVPRLDRESIGDVVPLIGTSFSTFGVNQRSHFHPAITPDRKYILFTGGDSRNKTNHLFLMDISDLKATEIK